MIVRLVPAHRVHVVCRYISYSEGEGDCKEGYYRAHLGLPLPLRARYPSLIPDSIDQMERRYSNASIARRRSRYLDYTSKIDTEAELKLIRYK